MHGPDDVCFCQELVCDTAAGSHCDSECDISMDCCVDRNQRSNFIGFPRGRAVSRSETKQMTSVFCWFRSAPTLALSNAKREAPALGGTGCHHHQGTRSLPGLRFLVEHVVMNFFWGSKLKVVDTMHSAALFVWKSSCVCWVVRAHPREGSCSLLFSNTQSCLSCYRLLLPPCSAPRSFGIG